MKIKRVLLTSDDGYNSIGIRLLAHLLKNKYDLKIAGTKNQQSGVGGKISILQGGKWWETTVEGVPALCVDGTPVDCIECAKIYFKKPFDLIISGINWGPNISTSLISSGTFSAAFYALGLRVSKYAIALSWDLPAELYFKKHKSNDELKTHRNYPAKIIDKLIGHLIENNFFDCQLLNINLPQKETRKIKFTQPYPYFDKVYGRVNLDKKTKSFVFPMGLIDRKKKNIDWDVDAFKNGYISITPCQTSFLKEDVYLNLKDKLIKL